MGIVSTIPEKCRRCYTCVHECPAKAIKVESGQATVIQERCIACGNCFKVCAQNAKFIEDHTGLVVDMLKNPQSVFACLAPSFPAAFYDTTPGRVVTALRRLGFSQVWEVAFGAELVSREYVQLFEESRRTGKRVIATPCPAIVAYVEKYMPSLTESLAPIVSPMIAVAKVIRLLQGPDVSIVFIGPCIAKKREIRDPHVKGIVDAALTYRELADMIEKAGIHLNELPESGFDNPPCSVARSFAISGGLLRTSGLSMDILENDIIVTEGKDRVLAALKELAEGLSGARLFDVLFCEGCISGPKMMNELSVFARKEILAEFVKQQKRQAEAAGASQQTGLYEGLDLSRAFTPENLILPHPSAVEITAALQAMKKLLPEDQLNCGACGYGSCREKAIAVCQGLAEAEMCLPYLVEELEETCVSLKQSHEELTSAQQRLVQTERLASVGELSAGVAHELNNPLGTILIYSHLLLKEIQSGDSRRKDMEMILSEATRCKHIVRSLLDFARQSRVLKNLSDLTILIQDVAGLMTSKANNADVVVTAEIHPGLPLMLIDGHQIKQVLINLVDNSFHACQNRQQGRIVIAARRMEDGRSVEIRVTDNGHGIPPENVSKLFTPFFTTKGPGKGTGLGLAISYGIIKMHSGDISVESRVGEGTTFTIRLPLNQENTERLISAQTKTV